MNMRFFAGSFSVIIGEYENSVRYLLVANSADAAWGLLDRVCAEYYGTGDEEADEYGDFSANNGEVLVRPKSVQEIGLAAWLEFKDILPVRYAENLNPAKVESLVMPADFNTFVTSLRRQLEQKGLRVGQNILLHAVAGALGTKNWHVLKQHLKEKVTRAQLVEALESVRIQMAPQEHGPEPALAELVTQYYTLHGVERKKALELTTAFLAAWVDTLLKAPAPEQENAEDVNETQDLSRVRLLAKDFSRALRKVLTQKDLYELLARNAAEPENSAVCHSHAFCDADLVMQEVFEQHGLIPGGPLSAKSAAESSLWSQAWKMAKKAGFDPERI